MIDLQERRLTITYAIGDRFETFTGWAMLSVDGRRVVARKPRGTRRWHLCNPADVVSVKAN